MKVEKIKVSEEEFVKMIKDDVIREKLNNNRIHRKKLIFFLEECEYLDRDYLSISLFKLLLNKKYSPKEKIVYIDQNVAFLYLPEKACSFTISSITPEIITYILTEENKYHKYRAGEAIILNKKEFFLVSDRGVFDIKNKIIYDIEKIEYTIHGARRGTAFLLLTKEFQNFAIVPTYTNLHSIFYCY
ncbi:MAG: hypothetical protein QW051_04085 [Candidatus Aenigmatarchaeota archaeon]